MFDQLKSVPRSKDYSQDNPALERAIEAVKSANPHRFLQPHELKERKFFDEPASRTPMKSFVQMCPAFAQPPIKPRTVLKRKK